MLSIFASVSLSRKINVLQKEMNQFLPSHLFLNFVDKSRNADDILSKNSELIDPKIETKEDVKNVGFATTNDGKYSCKHCDKKLSTKNGMMHHIDAIHNGNGVQLSCDQCGHQSTTPGNLRRHIQIKHEGVKFQCDQCLFQANRKDRLKEHVNNTHSASLKSLLSAATECYSCKYCDKKLSTKAGIQQHVQKAHNESKFPCDQCSHQASSTSNLRRHIKVKHEGVKYECDQCEYKAPTKYGLKDHKHNKH